MTIEFGKYRGYDIREVPVDYLYWLQSRNQQTLDAVNKEIERREAIEDASDDVAVQIIRSGYRQLVKEAHPDTGGDPVRAAQQIEDLQNARIALEEAIKILRHPVPEPEPQPARAKKKKGPQTETYWCESCQAWHTRTA